MSNYRNSGYKRIERDFYPTPSVYIDILLEHWTPNTKLIHEPCAGEGDMVEALNRHGFLVSYADISNGVDYLEDNKDYDCIITNSPYGDIGPKIVRHALEYTQECAFLLPFDWDCAGSRSDLFGVDSPFYMKLVINQRYKWIEGSKTSGMHNYAWYVWDQAAIGEEQITRYGPK